MEKIKALLRKIREALGPLLKRALAFLKPVAKNLAADLVRQELARLRDDVKKEVLEEGPKARAAIDRFFDGMQARLTSALEGMKFLPNVLRLKVIDIVRTQGDVLQEKVKEAADSGSLSAVDAAFQGMEALVVVRIQAL